MTKLALVLDGVTIGKRIASFAKTMKELGTEAHLLAVSSIYHAANSGRGDVLNSFYAALNPAMQGSFRAYLGNRGISANIWLAFSTTKGFTVTPEKMEAREEFKAKAETLDRPFWELDTNPNQSILDDKSLLARINGLVKQVYGDTSTASPQAKAIVLSFAKEMSTKMKGVEGADKLAKTTLDISPAPAKGKASPKSSVEGALASAH